MTFRGKIKRAFGGRSSPAENHKEGEKAPETDKQAAAKKTKATTPQSNTAAAKTRFAGVKPRKRRLGKDGKPKIELYKPHEVPPSKFRGPFDPVHMKKLADYSISDATANHQRRSRLSQLSPTDGIRQSMEDQMGPETALDRVASQEGPRNETAQSSKQMPESRLESASLSELSPTQTFEKDLPIRVSDRASDATSVTHDGVDAFSSLTLGSSHTEATSHHPTEPGESRTTTPNLSSPPSKADNLALAMNEPLTTTRA